MLSVRSTTCAEPVFSSSMAIVSLLWLRALCLDEKVETHNQEDRHEYDIDLGTLREGVKLCGLSHSAISMLAQLRSVHCFQT